MKMNIIITRDKKEDLWYCDKCKTFFKNENQNHDCNNMQLKNFMRSRLRKETIKYSVIGFFASLIIFLSIMVGMYRQTIYEYSQLIQIIKTEIQSMKTLTETVVNGQENAINSIKENRR